jgi:DNA-binding transcriptional ArsR family regulator
MTELEQLQASAEQAATLLKAMSNPRRLLILCTLCGAPAPARGAGACHGLSPSATSQHLARMREEGLIDSTREAQRILYFIKNDAVHQLISTLKTLYCP